MRIKTLGIILGAGLVIKLTVIAIAAVLLNGGPPWVGHIITDIWLWIDPWRLGQQGKIPYVDFTREYPVGAGLLYWIMTPFIDLTEGNWKSILLTHSLFMAIADVINGGILYLILAKINPGRAWWLSLLFLLTPTALLLTPMRFESYLVTPILLGYLCHQRQKPLWATFWWSLGCWIKFLPLFFILAQEIRTYLIEKRRNQWYKAIAIFVGVALVINLPLIWLSLIKNGNINNWLHPYSFWANRSITFDTVLGVQVLWLGGEANIGLANQVTAILLGISLVLRRDLGVAPKGVLFCIALLFLNRIYSPQHNLWFYPFLLVLIAEAEANFYVYLGIYLAIDLLNILVFPFSFTYAIMEMGKDNQNAFEALAAKNRGGVWTNLFSSAILLRASLLLGLGAKILSDRFPAKSLQLELDL
ncbi:MAG: hypothetical protein SFT94_01570 [Pseudanabaenaceae cyanobacterium bins.68]|nr:hypothetical protein [Pseudanabaenaceae cyanobacterium bins.68]